MSALARSCWKRVPLMLLLVPLGCGYGLMQTGFTEPPGKLGFTMGGGKISNQVVDAQSEKINGVAAELGMRVGITRWLDVGAAPYLAAGGRVDAKINLIPQPSQFAVGPRLGLGYAHPGRNVVNALAGAVGSYRWGRVLEPYAGITFSNHWFERDDLSVRDAMDSLGPNQHLVGRKGYGDGLLQTVIGLNLRLTRTLGFMGEYGHWFTMQNDPGDLYKFVPTNVWLLGFYFHSSDPGSGFVERRE